MTIFLVITGEIRVAKIIYTSSIHCSVLLCFWYKKPLQLINQYMGVKGKCQKDRKQLEYTV